MLWLQKSATSILDPIDIYVNDLRLYYKGQYLSVCGHYNVQMLTSPPILKVWDTQGYLWLPYDLTEVSS